MRNDRRAIATGGIYPDLTILLDLPAEVAHSRRHGEADRMERRGDDYMEAVRQAFLKELPNCGGESVVIDATQGPEDVWHRIAQAVESIL